MRYVVAFFAFWYDFLVGDDWLAALGAVAALGLTAALTGAHNPWWLLPVAIAAVLTLSVRRAARAAQTGPADSPPAES
jgi:hypothetical protein